MRSIVGTWRLVAAVAHDGNGQPLPPPYGAKGMGRVAFSADGRMMSVVCDGRPELPLGVDRDYSSYCGNYTFDGGRTAGHQSRRRIGSSPDRQRAGARRSI